MVRVLHIVGTMGMGGQETFIMNLYRNMDKSKIQFDFVVHSSQRSFYEDEIEKMGGRIYRISPISKNIFKHLSELKKIIKDNKYNIVHRHTASSIIAFEMLLAKICGVKYRIAHSHNTSSENKVIHYFFRPLLNMCTNYKFACSDLAGKWLFGNNKKFEIIKNGIDVEKFKFSEGIRNKKREELAISDDKIVIGNVARFNKQKNHEFLIDVFYEIQKNNSNYILLLVGDGEELENIEDKVKKLKIEEKVLFLKIRNDVNELLQAMDIFILPSLYEGLPVSLVEAQASGINLYVSDTITKEISITNNIKYLSLENDAKWWAKTICQNDIKRECEIENITKNGYNVKENARILQERFINMK